jgi:hypothetical protein
MNIYETYVSIENERHGMSSATADPLPSLPESPVDALDHLLMAGAAVGLLTYGGGLLFGDVATATLGVSVGVVCVVQCDRERVEVDAVRVSDIDCERAVGLDNTVEALNGRGGGVKRGRI